MKLGQIREILDAYEQNKRWWAWLFGDAAEVLRLKAHVLHYKDQPDEYELTGAAFLEVVRISLLPSYSHLSESLKNAINYPRSSQKKRFTTEISHILQEAGLLTEENFALYANCNASKSYSIWSTLAEFKGQADLPFTQKYIEFLFYLESIHFNHQNAINFLKALHHHGLVNEGVLDFLKMKGNDIFGPVLIESIIVFDALGLFERNNQEANLAFLNDEKYTHFYFNLLVLLSKCKVKAPMSNTIVEYNTGPKIRELNEGEEFAPSFSHVKDQAFTGSIVVEAKSLLDEEIFQAWLSAEPLVISQMEKILPCLMENDCLEKEDVLGLFKKEWSYFHHLEKALKILDDNKALSNSTVKWLLAKKDLYGVENVLSILAKSNLLSRPVIKYPFPEDDYHFTKIIRYLHEANVLNEKTFNALLILVKLGLENKIEVLLDSLSKNKFNLNEQNACLVFERALQINDNYSLSEVATVFSLLCKEENAMATNENLTCLLHMPIRNLRIIIDMVETLAKNKLLDQDSFSLALERACLKLPKVANGYAKKDMDKKVKHEVKYHQLLGRKSPHFFKQEKSEEISLDEFSSTYLQSQSFSVRLQWVMSGLAELQVLHNHHRIHGNVIPMSFAVNVKEMSLSLIDFKEARKRYSQKAISHFSQDVELAVHFYKEDFCDDMYGYAFVIAKIFPEIYEMDAMGSFKIKANRIETTENHAIQTLVDAMLCTERRARCSSREAFHYCQQLVDEKEWDVDKVNAIADATIRNLLPTLEDTLRGVSRFSI